MSRCGVRQGFLAAFPVCASLLAVGESVAPSADGVDEAELRGGAVPSRASERGELSPHHLHRHGSFCTTTISGSDLRGERLAPLPALGGDCYTTYTIHVITCRLR